LGSYGTLISVLAHVPVNHPRCTRCCSPRPSFDKHATHARCRTRTCTACELDRRPSPGSPAPSAVVVALFPT
jgi:hypothetical protein